MQGARSVRLMQPVRRKKGDRPEKSKADTVSWEGVDHELFEAMRVLRKQIADERKVPPYVVFSDATLRELARVRPSSLDRMRYIYGIGVTKLLDFGGQFLKLLDQHCSQHNLARDNSPTPPATSTPAKSTVRINVQRDLAFDLFRRGTSVDEVMRRTERSRSTVYEYLEEFIRAEPPASVSAWVHEETYEQIAAAVRQVGAERLKPIFLALGERISYDDIRIARAHLKVRREA
jgi:ATP-dependent DNA helicase RecQ